MRLRFSFLCVLALISLTSCDDEDHIPVIGLHAEGGHGQTFVPKSEYPRRLLAATLSVQESTLRALEKSPPSFTTGSSGWMLRTLSIGVEVNASIGIGPLKVGAFPRFRMIFTNNLNPIMP